MIRKLFTLGLMEGQSNQDNPAQTTPFNSGGTSNHVSHSAEDVAAAGGKNGIENHWTYLPEPFHNYAEYLTEISTYLPNTTTQNVLGSCYSPVGTLHNGTIRNFSYNDPGKSCRFKLPDSSTDIDFKKVSFRRSGNEGDQAMKFASSQHDLHAKSHASWTPESSTGNKQSVSRLDPRLTVDASGFLLKPRCSSSKQKASVTDRQRRQRIADNFKALHNLLPTPTEGSQAYIVDDVIDYVKYLQLQIKELSGSRLQGDSTGMQLFFREGYGHYINQQMLNDPLEEVMGKLLGEHPAAAAQLLESKGLFLLPVALVEDLRQAMQMFGGIPRV
ncbi:transcription factor bHLH83-like isoform X1 [Senna tora]|uniref:Transcription factor bHLH83-like isoform X1 n=1 Tax=Senna tora TaxID=362788 RepID=A0A834WD89_9FABA|nr:transcription factor bHLH83-like isoform X1 [Senna tora]